MSFTAQDIMDVFHARERAEYVTTMQTAFALRLIYGATTGDTGLDDFLALPAQYERGDFARYYNLSLH